MNLEITIWMGRQVGTTASSSPMISCCDAAAHQEVVGVCGCSLQALLCYGIVPTKLRMSKSHSKRHDNASAIILSPLQLQYGSKSG